MSSKPKNMATKYENALKSTSIDEIEEIAEKNRLVEKEVILNIVKLKSNMLLLEKVRLYPKTNKIIVPGSPNYNSKEEAVYEVILAGERTDNYNIEVEIGDLVIVTHVLSENFNGATKVLVRGKSMSSLLTLASLSEVMMVVKYDKVK